MNKSGLSAVESRLMQTLIPFLFIGLATTPVLARAPREDVLAHSKIPTVLVLGDSLSAGYGLHRSDAYPALLSEKAAAAGERLHVINAGVSGDTTGGGLRRLNRLLEQHVDVLVLELGINDAFRGVPVREIEANLQAIIDRMRHRYPQVRIVIAGMQLPYYSGGDYLNNFGAIYARLAQRNHTELVPFLLHGVAGDPALNQRDMIHPNASGQKILAANVWPAVETALKKSKQS
ncbi:MAG TPA: arylesterase [Chthoniobacterales bacterium]|jgi:acyl-CoA thioesterase-1